MAAQSGRKGPGDLPSARRLLGSAARTKFSVETKRARRSIRPRVKRDLSAGQESAARRTIDWLV